MPRWSLNGDQQSHFCSCESSQKQKTCNKEIHSNDDDDQEDEKKNVSKKYLQMQKWENIENFETEYIASLWQFKKTIS